MSKIKFRALTAHEIECRPASIGDGWVQLLLYKDARCDMSILDETVGAENWERSHYDCKGNLFCNVSINMNYDDETKEPRFISKSDCGSESNTEKEKGESSDSFKRACTNWGIGRELYTKIPIFLRIKTEQSFNGKWIVSDKNRFYVDEIKVCKEKNRIDFVRIVDKNGYEVFKWTNTVCDQPITTNIQNSQTVAAPVQQAPVQQCSQQTQAQASSSFMNQTEQSGSSLNGKTRVRR